MRVMGKEMAHSKVYGETDAPVLQLQISPNHHPSTTVPHRWLAVFAFHQALSPDDSILFKLVESTKSCDLFVHIKTRGL